MSLLYEGISAQGSTSSWHKFIEGSEGVVACWFQEDQSQQEDPNNTSFAIVKCSLLNGKLSALGNTWVYLDPWF